MPSFVPLIALGTLVLLVQMFVLWAIAMRVSNAGFVDVGWTIGLPVLGLLYAGLGPGYWLRQWLLAAMVLVWGVRLGWHLLRRVLAGPEDGRYREIRQRWAGQNIGLRFLWFFEFQGLLDVLLSLPMLIVAQNRGTRLSGFEYAGAALWLLAVAGESAADHQLAVFKRTPGNGGRVCNRGLWRYSRHPNYFFEWLVWVAWMIFALGSPYGWLTAICPALMLYFLLRVTGVAATEAHALKTRGEEYAQYRRSTSAFFPWFPKRTE